MKMKEAYKHGRKNEDLSVRKEKAA